MFSSLKLKQKHENICSRYDKNLIELKMQKLINPFFKPELHNKFIEGIKKRNTCDDREKIHNYSFKNNLKNPFSVKLR